MIKSGAHLSKNLDFTVSGPCRPAQALLQDGYEAGDGFSMGAAPDLPCFCHKGESRRKALRTMAYLKKTKQSIRQLLLLVKHWIF